ncbi:MAG: hypothetical protein OEQ24_10275 [Gammaproteobacteria bacterium]|nr:hypothetical protein [Gammaproteobacteria bacterium]
MCFFISLMPATFWLVVGYFVLFSSTKAEGGVKIFGNILAIWIFIITAFIPIAGAYVAFSDLCPLEEIMENMHFERDS